jgi:MFS family permease
LFLIMLVPTGLAVLTFTTAANSATQLGTTAEMRGRVMGLYMLVFLGGTPIGSPLVGWIAETLGVRMSIISGGVISGVATLVIAALLARAAGMSMRQRVRPAMITQDLGQPRVAVPDRAA